MLFDKTFASIMLKIGIGFHFANVIQSRGMSHLSAIFNFDCSIQITCPLKMLHFDLNPISIGHLVADI